MILLYTHTTNKKGGTKTMKKLISILLAVVMCFTMTTVAFAADENPEVSEDSITSILLEAVKVASGLNDEVREQLGEEIEKLLIEQIAGSNPVLQQAAQWVLDKALEISGTDNILTLNKDQAEQIAEFLTKVYDGDIAEYIDNPVISLVVSLVPKEIFKEVVVWLLSDGLGDTLEDFIDQNGGGSGVEGKPDSGKDEQPDTTNPFEGMDWAVAISAAFQAVRDFFDLLIKSISDFFSGLGLTLPA